MYLLILRILTKKGIPAILQNADGKMKKYQLQWLSMAYQPFGSSCRFYRLRAIEQNIRYSGVNCTLEPSKSIRYSGDFIIAGFVIAGFVSPYFTAILPGF